MERQTPRIILSHPGYGQQTAAAGRGVWRACRSIEPLVVHLESSLLATNFNHSWVMALNEATTGDGCDYFAMLHSDIGPEDYWLDMLIAELEAKQLDVLGVAVPIKDERGLTSLAVDGESTWRPKRRITQRELWSLPETFTSDDVDGPLLLNTGCWVCKFDPAWADEVHFTVNDRIVYNAETKRYYAETEPEDWFFSRLCHELKLNIGATRIVNVKHRGQADFDNHKVWGFEYDREYASESIIKEFFPAEIPGWLSPEEGQHLAKIASGNRVLEIGSYCGRSTVCMARTATEVACVDYFDGRATPTPDLPTFARFQRSLNDYGVSDKVTTYHPDNDELPSGYFDIAFIDGDHHFDAVMRDIEKASRALKPGGLLAFHDYQNGVDPDVTAAVDSLLENGGQLVSCVKTVAVVRPPIPVTCK